MDKYLKRALDELLLIVDDCENEKDIDKLISSMERDKAKMENLVIEAKEVISNAEYGIERLHLLKHQIKIERYKDLNKGLDIEIF